MRKDQTKQDKQKKKMDLNKHKNEEMAVST